ncbi:MAG: proline--tRNA ligase [bacterium]
MRYSKLFIPTVKEAPSDADVISHKLMFRAGMIRKVASGIYEWLPVGYRVLKKVEEIIRQEMNKVSGQEVWLPALLPRELWEETGRWNVYGRELMRVKDRHERDFALGPTHEEIITDLVRHEVRSYKELPLMFYQFQTKFRDEIRPRFGIMRAREFYMKDAYSFHANEEDAQAYYQRVYDAYCLIFERCGLKFQAVEALTGAIGGSFSHEFMVLAPTGEEGIVSCQCGYGANTEKAEFSTSVFNKESEVEELKELETIHTPSQKTVEELTKYLNTTPKKFIKTLIYLADKKPVIILIRGDREVNEKKLQELLTCNELVLADEKTIQKVTGAPLGFAGPVITKKGDSMQKKDIKILADISAENIVNAISGANKKDYHLKNININRDYKPDEVINISKIAASDLCRNCSKELRFSRGIEVGHTFKLGTKYSTSMKAKYTDQDGKEQVFIMGCYGIGVSRIVAAAIEQNNDEKGIIWPISIAPFHVCIVPINYDEPKTKEISDKLYEELINAGVEVLLDDRPLRAGVKFQDVDLIGVPIRITVSEKKVKNGNIGIKMRSENEEKECEVSLVKEMILGKMGKMGTTPYFILE